MLATTLSVFILLTCLLWLPYATADQVFSSLEERMTGQEFADAGLERLTATELAALNTWIRDRSLAQYMQAAKGSENFSGQASSEDDAKHRSGEPIISRIKGSFQGWDGNTVFELENGMIWVQDDKDTFFIKAVENPEVLIKPGMFSAWKLSIEGYNSNVKVKRIQ